jgi:AraC-like DNA-binding protein
LNTNLYIPQIPAFKSIIHSIWEVEGLTPFCKECIIPKGIIEIIFNFSNSLVIPAQLGNRQYHLPGCFINGFNTAPIQIQLPKQQHFFGVCFQPLAVKKIFGAPASEFLDTSVDITLLDPEFHSLWHLLGEQNDFKARVVVFINWMEKTLIDWKPQESLINDFLCTLSHHDLSVTELAASLCYSPRQLSRKIVEATGLNTEEILLYKKYLQAVHLIHHTNLPLTDIAYRCYFSDQSHFIKSFKQYAKMTPGEYRRNKSNQKGHLYEFVR